MNTHPTATLHMANGSKIVIELLPEAAPKIPELSIISV